MGGVGGALVQNTLAEPLVGVAVGCWVILTLDATAF